MRKVVLMFLLTTLIALGIAARPIPGSFLQLASVTGGGETSLGDIPGEVKVLTISMFEFGEPKGDIPGEAQLWIEGEELDTIIEIPGSYSPAYCNETKEHCLVVTGVGTANAAATIMAIGESNQLDLSRAYINIAGIAGVSPRDGTLGTAAWAEWVVDGDISHQIDSREIPEEWDYPYFRLGCSEPWCDEGWEFGTEVYQLNSTLTEWAYRISKNVQLSDSQEAQDYRRNYPEGTAAIAEPAVTKCDSFAASTYWHGQTLSNWAEWWTKQWTKGEGNYCMSNMEDSGTLTALTRLSNIGKIDLSRVMLLRTASNFDQPYSQQTAQQSIRVENNGGFKIAIQNAYKVGVVVTHYIIDNWENWQDGVPELS